MRLFLSFPGLSVVTKMAATGLWTMRCKLIFEFICILWKIFSFLFFWSCQLIKQCLRQIFKAGNLAVTDSLLASYLPYILGWIFWISTKFKFFIRSFTLALIIFKTRSSPCPGSHSSSPGLLLLRSVQPRRWAFNLSLPWELNVAFVQFWLGWWE